MTKTILFETDAGKFSVSTLSFSARRPADVVHHPATMVFHEAVLDADGAVVEDARSEETAPAYDEIVAPEETDAEFVARMVATIVPNGKRHIVIDPALMPALPPERWIVDWTTGAISVAPVGADDLKAIAAAKRYAIETGGCSDGNGHRIATDRNSQSKLLAEMVAIGAGMRADPSTWKMADGSFVALSNAGMLAAIGAVRAHIATAFGVESAVCAAIDGGTITTGEHIDAAPWPGNG